MSNDDIIYNFTFARVLVPRLTALQRDLVAYLRYYNEDRPNTGRFARGRIPADMVCGDNKMRTPKKL